MRSDRIYRYSAAATAALAATSAHADIMSATTLDQQITQTNVQYGGLVTLFDNTVPGIEFAIWAKNYVTNTTSAFIGFFGSTTNMSMFDASAGASITGSTLTNMGSGFGYGPAAPGWVNTGGMIGLGSNKLLGFKVRNTAGGVLGGIWTGWIEYTAGFAEVGYYLIINDWAINTTEGGSIIAGQHIEGSSGGAVPGLGGLAALACGAAGVRSRRQRVA